MIAALLVALGASVAGGSSALASRPIASDLSTGSSTAAGAVVPPDGDPAVRITLSNTTVYDPGDRARVRVHVRDDAYLLVLMADPSGTVRILYPARPGDDDFVHAGEDFDVRGRGDDASFIVDNVRGTGTVYAAVSKDPFRFDALANGSEWAGNALPDTARGDNAEAVLTAAVQRVATAGGRFDYDLVTYTVTARRAPRNDYARGDDYAYPPGDPGYGYPYYDPWYGPAAYGVGFGPWWGYNPWYGPWGYSPWWGYNAWYGGFGPTIGFGIGFGGCWGCYGGGYWGGYRGYYGAGPLVHRPGFVPPIGYRPRSAFFAGRTVPSLGRFGGTPYGHAGIASHATVFANARLTTAPGGVAGIGYRARGTMARTVFPQTHSVAQAARPGMGHVVTEAPRGVRATPYSGGRAERVPGHMGASAPGAMGPARSSGPARAYRAQVGPEYRAPQYRAQEYRAPSAGTGGGGYAAPRGGGGGGSARSGGGGGGGGGGGHSSGRSGGGGGGHSGGGGGGGHSGGGGGHGHR